MKHSSHLLDLPDSQSLKNQASNAQKFKQPRLAHLREEEDSPFLMVRCVVKNRDDPTLPALTHRVLLIGSFLTIIFAWLRNLVPLPFLEWMLLAQGVAFIVGKLVALPSARPFNIKEHVMIALMINAGLMASSSPGIPVNVLKNQTMTGWLWRWCWLLSVPLMALGFTGCLRAILVRPASMIWPSTLVYASFFGLLHPKVYSNSSSLKSSTNKDHHRQLKFFLLVLIAMVLYYLALPSFVMGALVSVSLLCLFDPTGILLTRQLGSGSSGWGMMSLTFDWSTISGVLGSPLVAPFWAQVNVFTGFVLIYWLVLPMIYYFRLSHQLPVLASSDAMNDSSRHSFSTLALYGVAASALAALLTHTTLYHGADIFSRLKSMYRNKTRHDDDIHTKLIDRYPAVPNRWYTFVLVLGLLFGVTVCLSSPVAWSWFAVVTALAIFFVFSVPLSLMMAISNQSITLSGICELFIAATMGSSPSALMNHQLLQWFGAAGVFQVIGFSADQKLATYMKIPPQALWLAQMLGIMFGSMTGSFFLPVETLAESTEFFGFIQQHLTSRYVVYLLVISLVGFLLPVPFWFLARKLQINGSRNQFWHLLHIPVLLGSSTALLLAPFAKPSMYLSWFLIGFFFQFCLFRYRHGWWRRYNFVCSGALQLGVVIAMILLGLTYQAKIHQLLVPSSDCKPF